MTHMPKGPLWMNDPTPAIRPGPTPAHPSEPPPRPIPPTPKEPADYDDDEVIHS